VSVPGILSGGVLGVQPWSALGEGMILIAAAVVTSRALAGSSRRSQWSAYDEQVILALTLLLGVEQ
jgi:hypothetical protein